MKKGSKLVSIYIGKWRENIIICWEKMRNNNKTKKKEYGWHLLFDCGIQCHFEMEFGSFLALLY